MKNNFTDEELKQNIGKNIAEYRKFAGMSQIEFAEKLNYSDKAVSKWERGESLPDIVVLTKIANLFDISINDLITSVNKKRKLAFKKILKNKVLAMMIWVACIWLIATTCFVFFSIFNVFSRNWLVFILAIPISCIVCTICCICWRQKLLQMIFASLFIWSALVTVCISFYFYDIWLSLVIAIPLQIIFILVYFFRRKKK